MTIDQNRALAAMGYAAYERTLRLLGIWEDPAFDDLDVAHQLAESERAASIRRWVVTWGLSAEQEDVVPDPEPSALDADRAQRAAGEATP
jgi:hypothetical protein